MYSDKEQNNILVAGLLAYGVRHAVVCPGSRNAPIVHRLVTCGSIACHAVTDERSAGFYALGMAEATNAPVVVCVTSGSALLNVLPAVAEAYYQHRQLVVVSADRPARWIDQLDGQTLPQTDALGRFVRKAVCLPTCHTDEDRWYCQRLVNEALLATDRHGCGPVHINVPIEDPTEGYTMEELPYFRRILAPVGGIDEVAETQVIEAFCKAHRPLIVIGQQNFDSCPLAGVVEALSEHVTVLFEKLGVEGYQTCHFEEVLARQSWEPLMPDFILQIGDVLVSKRLRQFLRQSTNATTWTVRADSQIHDTFMSLAGIAETHPGHLLTRLAEVLTGQEACEETKNYNRQWQALLCKAGQQALELVPAYSQLSTVSYFEEQLEDMPFPYRVHYANSSAIRLGQLTATHGVYCNRGVNGIEGSLSTAAGMSLATTDMVFCVIGDLSFFYDQNALWHNGLGGNLRIILLNNGGGGIFSRFENLHDSPARDSIVGRHTVSAQGICTQNDVGYLKASNMEEMQLGIVQLLTISTKRPVLLEVNTTAETDWQVVKSYLASWKEKK